MWLGSSDTECIRPGTSLTSDHPELLLQRFPDAYEAGFKDTERSNLRVNIPAFTQNVVGLKIAVSDTLKTNEPIRLHFVQRNIKAKQIVGGIAIQLTVGGTHTGREKRTTSGRFAGKGGS